MQRMTMSVWLPGPSRQPVGDGDRHPSFQWCAHVTSNETWKWHRHVRGVTSGTTLVFGQKLCGCFDYRVLAPNHSIDPMFPICLHHFWTTMKSYRHVAEMVADVLVLGDKYPQWPPDEWQRGGAWKWWTLAPMRESGIPKWQTTCEHLLPWNPQSLALIAP